MRTTKQITPADAEADKLFLNAMSFDEGRAELVCATIALMRGEISPGERIEAVKVWHQIRQSRKRGGSHPAVRAARKKEGAGK